MNDVRQQLDPVEIEASEAHPAGEAEANDAETPSPRLVNVAEAIRYRKRAQAAEKELEQLRTQLNESQQEAQAVQDRLAEVERRAAIDAQLAEAGAADLQAAHLLVEAALSEDAGLEVAAAVQAVRRQRPQLFRAAGAAAGSAMGPAVHAADHGSRDIQRAANIARRSGHNADVMHYMNLRRSAPR
ncbi:MAG: hypothetical protein IT430_10005 [Phycisphaerales bacterium]|nr:hypothetical protein [Phycisphaerales bacterium]